MKKYSSYVSTKIGTIGDMTATSIHGGGKTHPGAIYPFGMVRFALSDQPDTEWATELPPSCER